MKKLIDKLAGDERVREAVEKSPATRELISRYIAGRDLDELMPVVDNHVWKGLDVSINYLAKQLGRVQNLRYVVDDYKQILQCISDGGFSHKAELSLRLSTVGMGQVFPEITLELAREITRTATNLDIDVCLDMEDFEHIHTVLVVHDQLHQDFPRIGVTVQANLKRSLNDVERLAEKNARIRIVKGSYAAPDADSFDSRLKVDQSYVHCLRKAFEGGGVPLVATHDPRLIEISEALVKKHGYSDYEYQMFYGVRTFEQRRLVDTGRTCRTQLPFGPDWIGYYLRRAEDRPSNLLLFMRSLIGKR